MAYVVKKQHINLNFADDHPDFPGLTVTVRRMDSEAAMDVMDEFAPLMGSAAKFSGGNLTPENFDATAFKDLKQAANRLATLFVEYLVSWDVVEEPDSEDGAPIPVPTTLDGLKRAFPFAPRMKLMQLWFSKVAGVSDDLGKGSPSGVTFPEGSLPMAPLSPNLPNFPVPA